MMMSVVITRRADSATRRSRLPIPFPVPIEVVLNISYLHSSARAAYTAQRPQYLNKGTTNVVAPVAGAANTLCACHPLPWQSLGRIVPSLLVAMQRESRRFDALSVFALCTRCGLSQPTVKPSSPDHWRGSAHESLAWRDDHRQIRRWIRSSRAISTGASLRPSLPSKTDARTALRAS
jgi:hypothetical protein